MKRLRNGVFATGNARAGRVASRHGRWRPSIAPYRDGAWAVRGMAFAPPVRHGVRTTRAAWRCAPPVLHCRAHHACGMVARPVPGALGVTRRCALRGPGASAGGRGRTETPWQNSQRVLFAMTTEHYPRVVRTAARWGHRALPPCRTRIMHAKFARVGHVHCPGDAMVAREGSPPMRRDNRLPGLPAPYRTPCRAKRTQRALR